jgi:hypothetical protein
VAAEAAAVGEEEEEEEEEEVVVEAAVAVAGVAVERAVDRDSEPSSRPVWLRLTSTTQQRSRPPRRAAPRLRSRLR